MLRSKIFVLASFLIFGGVTLGLYTNMASSRGVLDIRLENAKEESKKLSIKMDNKKYSPQAIALFSNLKRTITNYIAVQTRPKSCEDLLKVDKYMISGDYTVYPKTKKKKKRKSFFARLKKSKRVKKGELYSCEVEDGQVLSSRPVDKAPLIVDVVDQ